MLEWVMSHWDLLAALAGVVLAGWKAWKAGSLNGFLVEKVEGLAAPEDKKAIQESAIAAGLEGLLNKVVRKVTK